MGGAASSAARYLAGLGGLATLLLSAVPAAAQADPEPRAYAEVGTEIPLKGNAPINGYAFFLWNRPNFPNEDQYLRLVVAPTYLLTEFVQDHWPFGRHAVSIGLWGGGIRYGHEEYRHGSHQAEESFWGHGAELPLSYYASTKLFDKLPLQGQIRVTPAFIVYQDSFSTADDFELPPDTGLFTGRVGLRLGGVPPELLPQLALEASAWYEAVFRTETGTIRPPRPDRRIWNRSPRRPGGAWPASSSRSRSTRSTSSSPPARRAGRISCRASVWGARSRSGASSR